MGWARLHKVRKDRDSDVMAVVIRSTSDGDRAEDLICRRDGTVPTRAPARTNPPTQDRDLFPSRTPERTAHARQGPPDRGHSRIQRFRPPRLAQAVRRRFPPSIPRSPAPRTGAAWRSEPLAPSRRQPGHAGSQRRVIETRSTSWIAPPESKTAPRRSTTWGGLHGWRRHDRLGVALVQPVDASGESFSRSASRLRSSVTRRRLRTRVISSSLLTGFDRKSSVPLSTARS